jgi:hypothetical protein
MASKNWQVDASGSWSTGADWSGGVAPTNQDDATIAVAGITVSIGSGVAAVAHSLSTTYSVLDIKGGTLLTVQLAEFNGGFRESAGTFTAAGTGAIFNDGIDFTGGTIDVASGAAQINDGGTLAGTLIGSGGLDVNAGNVYIDSGFSCSLASIVVGASGGKLGLETNFSVANNLTVLQNGVLDLFGHTLTLSGASLLEGTVSLGSLAVTGTVTLGNPDAFTTLDDGLVVEVEGKMVQDGNVALGAPDAGAKINVGKTGQFDINGNWTITDPSSVGSIVNGGVLAKSFGGKSAIIDPSFSTTGKLEIEIGSLILNGLVNSLSGTISGAGTLGIGTLGDADSQTTLGTKLALDVGAVTQASGVLVLNSALSYAGIWGEVGGVLNLNGSAAVLTLTGAADFDGGTVTSYGGTLLLDGAAQAGNVTFGGPTVLDINSTFDQTNTITFGLYSNPVANIADGAKWVVEGDSDIIGYFGQINIADTGSFIDPNGSGDAIIQPEIDSNGIITVDNSTLTLAGTNDLAGTLSGTGLLELEGPTILAATSVTVATLTVLNGDTELGGNLTYAGNFNEAGNDAVLDLDGATLSLSGTLSNASLDAGLLTDGGTLSVAGHVAIGNYSIGGGAELLITGSAEQTGTLNLSPGAGAGTLVIAQGATYVLDDDLAVTASAGFGTITIAGTEDVDGTGITIVQSAIDELATGALVLNDTALQLYAGGAFAGKVSGVGTLALTGSAADTIYDLVSGVSLTASAIEVAGNANLDLLANISYAGLFTETAGGLVTLGTQTLTLSGTSVIGGTLAGPGGSSAGTLSATGTATIDAATVEQTAVLSITGTAAQYGAVTDNGLLLVAAAGKATINANSSISGTGAVSVAGGLFFKGDGTESVSTSVSVAGSLVVDSGTVAFSGPVAVAGSLTQETGTVSLSGSLGVTGGLTVDAGTFSSTGSVSVGGSLTIDSGTASMSGPVSVAGKLTLDSGSLSLSGGVVDTGTIAANLGTLSVLSAVTGSGSFSVGGGGLLHFGQAVAATDAVGFASGGGTLELTDLTNDGFLAHIAGFSSGDLIDISGFDLASGITDTWNSADTVLSISDKDGASGTLTFSSAQNTLSITVGTSTATGFVTVTHT